MDVDYATTVPGAAALEEEIRAARQRHRERLDALTALSHDHDALRADLDVDPDEPSSFGERIRGLLARVPWLAPLVGDDPDVLLEDHVDRAQRRVLELAHHLDRLAADRVGLEREVRGLERRIGAYTADAERAAGAILALELRHTQALEVGGDGVVLEAEIGRREHELRAFQRATRRLRAILHLHGEFLRLDESLAARLSSLHEAGAEALEVLDAELARLASTQRASELARVVQGDLGALRKSVARVNRLATEGAVLLTEDVDRLADEVDLLAPLDDAALAAEHEVSVHLRNRSVADAVARARQQVSLRGRLSGDDE